MPSHLHGMNGQYPMINYTTDGTTRWGHSTQNGDWWFMSVADSVHPTGGNEYHNIMQPWIAIHIWKRCL